MAQSTSHVWTMDCSTADEFLDLISPRGKLFYDFGPTAFIFRGHADARFQLVPSAFRLGTWIRTPRGWRKVESWSNQAQVDAERATVRAFFNRADAAGLPLPEDSQTLRAHIFEETIAVDEWPTRQGLSLLGLAQHHGLPTRLLDWSRSAAKASYFAARQAAMWHWGESQSPSGITRMGVWAYSLVAGSIRRQLSDVFVAEDRITVVTAPAAGNLNPKRNKARSAFIAPRRSTPMSPLIADHSM